MSKSEEEVLGVAKNRGLRQIEAGKYLNKESNRIKKVVGSE